MTIREATLEDVPQIQFVRNSVTENTLSDPSLVSDKDCEIFLMVRGKGWVAEVDHRIVGFAIVDMQQNNIWALFIHPEFEKKGIGRQLQGAMLNWYFSQTRHAVWLGTAYNTRAEKFYRESGWKEAGTNGPKEIRFEMSYEDWATANR